MYVPHRMSGTFSVVECFLNFAPDICGKDEGENCSRAKEVFYNEQSVLCGMHAF